MYSQRRVIDNISSFSPAREDWVSKPVEELPAQVTVTFKTGQMGILDMNNPRAVRWAKRIDKSQRADQPVYVEIDQESNIITNVRIPRVYRVERLEPDEHGNLMVRLQPSSAIHVLLQSDPNFESMRVSLQASLDDGSECLITETRDEHEIIDVREPESDSGGLLPPPSSPPIDPPVSEARAGELFDNMKAESCAPCSPTSDCIPFLYPDDGCWIRAHIMCHLMQADSEDPEKVWIYGSLSPATANHPDCQVGWGWHVAPTLMVSLSGGDEKQVIDPSLSPAPESTVAWKSRQGDPGATLNEGPWTDYNWFGDGNGPSVSLANAHAYMQYYREELEDRCDDFGPPPYSCTRRCFFIIDRNTFSDDEIEAMLHVGSPAEIEAAFYVVVDGFSPYDLGFTSATMESTPTLNISPSVSGMTITAERLEFEYPTHLNRRQRLTWVYNVSFTNTDGFTSERVPVLLEATLSSVSDTGYLYLIQQPNPYEIDGPTSWLSTDLRVFQINSGESKFNAIMGSDPSAFITQVIENLNTGDTGGQTFEDDISTDQQTSRLELSQTPDGVPVYNFAIAKVRYRAQFEEAQDVRVFFRLFPWETTSVEYDQATAYRRYESGDTIVPLLGIKDSRLTSIPCFASPRIVSDAVSMTTQPDEPNKITIPPNPSGAEVVRYFGCWLDINQPEERQFPYYPSPLDGPYTSGRVSIQDHIRDAHQCLVSEIAFTPAPAQNGSTPSTSDKLAQRNLAIVESANPGLLSSRRIPQTFEIRPSRGQLEHDELMIDWSNVPVGSVATLYLPDFNTNDILRLAAQKYRSHRLVRIDDHTLRLDTGGITYLPIPFADGSFPGLLTVDLPEGVEKGQVFKVVVRQVTGEQQPIVTVHSAATSYRPSWRHIIGSFQLTIPVRDKAEILPRQQRLLSNLRWIERAIPANDRWLPVFSQYVSQIADRVDALGGDSSKVAPSASGQWQEAYRKCLLLALAIVLLIATLVVVSGLLTGGLLAIIATLVFALLSSTVNVWLKQCRPQICQLLRVLLAGSGIGAIALVLLAILGTSTPQLITVLIVSAGVALVTAIRSWQKGCFV